MTRYPCYSVIRKWLKAATKFRSTPEDIALNLLNSNKMRQRQSTSTGDYLKTAFEPW
jgi:hypothetical protein